MRARNQGATARDHGATAGFVASLAGLFTALALAACAAPAHEPAPAPGGTGVEAEEPAAATPADTLRGTVAVVGAEPLTELVLQVDGRPIRLEGSAVTTLRHADGLEVRVAGTRLDDRFRVASFRVRGAHGLPAADGILALDGDDAVLATTRGELLRFRPAPRALREHEGARVWIAGAPGGEPQAWGILEPAG